MASNPINDELVNSIATKKVALALNPSITDEAMNAYIGGRIDQAVATTEQRGVLHNRVLERFDEMMSAAIEARDLFGTIIKVGDSVVVSEVGYLRGDAVGGLTAGTVVSMRRRSERDHSIVDEYEGVVVEVSVREGAKETVTAHRSDDVLVASDYLIAAGQAQARADQARAREQEPS